MANHFLIGQLPKGLRPRKLEDSEDKATSEIEFDLIRPVHLGAGWILALKPGRKGYKATDPERDKDAQKAISGHWSFFTHMTHAHTLT